jgi:hypothetical protein
LSWATSLLRICLGSIDCGVLLGARLRSVGRGVLLHVCLDFDRRGLHHCGRLGFTDRRELLRVGVDGLHDSWFEATVLDFEPACGRRDPARYTITCAHILADVEGVLAESFATLQAVHLACRTTVVFLRRLSYHHDHMMWR